ncbi:P-loop containing nucleoside triphosphate hydrolase protein [Gloeopeniophorella convolvens]|nr:P-loop containing nucleoside triphosphate hydrolase protein [Gloeopeniophorella convolvens]
MDDGLVLNLAFEEGSSTRSGSAKKGGRWTDRLKSKRNEKRKARKKGAPPSTKSSEPASRPAKRARPDPGPSSAPLPEATSHPPAQAPSKPRQPTQIISSLFSSNPKIEQNASASVPRLPSKPSNAPLTDSSTFEGLGLNPLITTHLTTKMDIMKPTSIQRASLSALLSQSDPASSRDAFIQSQTGSGKTLSYLLPILHDLLPLSSNSYIDRSIGTLAIIIAPTRELAKQISDVLETLLKLRLRPPDAAPDDEDTNSTRLTRWLVSGLLTGGATRGHEKARLRKGIPVLVATPGRLLDHLQNTSSFNVGKCRWLVLDEADRLMELGFADTIKGILSGLDGRRKLALQAVKEGRSMEVGGWDWDIRRRTVLCSATMREDVQVLAGTTLQDPVMIKATDLDLPKQAAGSASEGAAALAADEKFTPPSQLSQKYIVTPLKLRLVTLVALLRSLLSQSSSGRRGSKIIVFLSCTDSVDFHWRLFGSSTMGSGGGSDSENNEDDSSSEDETKAQATTDGDRVEVRSPLLPETAIFRLHGSLPLATRLSSLRAFSAIPKTPGAGPAASILLCTSVAARGLDLPRVRAVVQYDLPTEGGATEYVHRVGRTARAGRGGEAWALVAPSEALWVEWVQARMAGGAAEGGAGSFQAVAVEDVLQRGFGGKGNEFEERATEVQLAFERWCLQRNENVELARKAFASHMRAYATHPSDEKHIFHIRHLHLGHLAKAFALRDAPSAVGGKKSRDRPGKSRAGPSKVAAGKAGAKSQPRKRKERDAESDEDDPAAERRMRAAVRSQGRLVKKGGVMASSGMSEFQVASGDALERLANRM